MHGEIIKSFVILKNKEASSVICFVVKHLGNEAVDHSRRREKHLTTSRVFSASPGHN